MIPRTRDLLALLALAALTIYLLAATESRSESAAMSSGYLESEL